MKFLKEFVCEPNHIRIKAKNINETSRGIKIEFYLYDKFSFSFKRRLSIHRRDEDEINSHVAKCCKIIKSLTEDYIQEYFDAEEIMGALNVHRHLNKTSTKGGIVLWRHK